MTALVELARLLEVAPEALRRAAERERLRLGRTVDPVGWVRGLVVVALTARGIRPHRSE